MSSFIVQGQKAANLYSPNQSGSDIKQHLINAPKYTKEIYIDESPDVELQKEVLGCCKMQQVSVNNICIIQLGMVIFNRQRRAPEKNYKIQLIQGSGLLEQYLYLDHFIQGIKFIRNLYAILSNEDRQLKLYRFKMMKNIQGLENINTLSLISILATYNSLYTNNCNQIQRKYTLINSMFLEINNLRQIAQNLQQISVLLQLDIRNSYERFWNSDLDLYTSNTLLNILQYIIQPYSYFTQSGQVKRQQIKLSIVMNFSIVQEPQTSKIHTPNQFVSDIKQYFTKAPKQARKTYLDETPDFEQQSKSYYNDSNDAKLIAHTLVGPQKWKSYPFKIIYLVGSFLYKAKTSTDSYRFKLLDKRIFLLINDLSSDFNYYQKRRMFKKQIDNLSVLIENLSPNCKLVVFQPDDLIKLIFDALLVLLTAFIITYIPIQISFPESYQLKHNYFELIPGIMVFVEIIIKLNSAFYQDGVVIQSRRQIAQTYFKDELIFDICYLVSFFMFLNGFKYLQLIHLLRVKRLKQYIDRIEDITFMRERYAASIDLTKLIFFLFFINHICACIWNFIGEVQLNSQTENWIHFYGVVDVGFYSRYMRSFYWCMITTTTVGYGDIAPTNDLERFICCLIILIGQIAFGYTISSIGEIFKQIEEKTNTFKTQMSKVTYYLKEKKFDKQLQMKIIRQFEYLYSQKYKSDQNEIENLITQLIPEIAAEVKAATYLPILQKNRIFRTKFSPGLLYDLSQIMMTKSYNNGQTIIDTNQNVQSLIFIAEGSLAAIAQQNYLRSYKTGYVVGLKNFIIQQPVACSFKAETSCSLYLLPYEGFIQCLKKYQEDLEKFQMLKDDLIFKQHNKQIGEVCKVCKSNHSFFNCPFPFFQFNTNRLIRNQLQDQQRSQKDRRSNKMMGFRQALKDYQLYAINASIKLTNLKEEDIDASYEARLGLTTKALSLNQPIGSINQSFNQDLSPSLNEITSRLQINSRGFDPELSLKEIKFSNLQAFPITKQTSIKHTSYINQNPRSYLKLEPQQHQSKELDQEIKFSQLEQIQLQEYLDLYQNTLNLDRYAEFSFYKQGQNLVDILNEFTQIRSKKIIRSGQSSRYLHIKQSKSILPSQRSRYEKH